MIDPSLDRHLSQALAHAPDKHALPPEYVSAQILAAAHRATLQRSQSRASEHTPWWRRPWGASGALATLVMAGFIGLLWRGESPGPAVDGPSLREVPAAQVAVAPAPAVLAAASEATAISPRAAVKLKAEVPAVAQNRSPRETALQREVVVPEVGSRAEREDGPVKTMAAPQQRALSGAAEADSAGSAAAVPAPAAPSPAPLAAPAPSPAPAPAKAAPALAALASRATRMPSSAQATTAQLQQALPEVLPGDTFVWLAPAQSTSPDVAWMQQLTKLAGARWQAEERSPPGAGSALRWERSGSTLGLLRMEGDAIWWCAAGQTCLLAKVPTDALRDLIRELPSNR